jgi:lipoprotein signal peptidase
MGTEIKKTHFQPIDTPPNMPVTVIPGFFAITHVHNPGGAFGFLAAMSAEVRSLLFVVVSLLAAGLIVYFYWQTPPEQRVLSFGLAWCSAAPSGTWWTGSASGSWWISSTFSSRTCTGPPSTSLTQL